MIAPLQYKEGISMAQFKKYGVPALLIVAALAVNLLISILLHGYFMAVIEDPFTVEGLTQVFEDQADSQVLDTFSDGDSGLTLVKKADGSVFLLEFHKNILLNRYQILDVIHIPEDLQKVPVKTVLRNYSVTVDDRQQLNVPEEIGFSLNFSNFFLLYLMNALLLTGLEYIVYKTGKNYKKAKAAAKKK